MASYEAEAEADHELLDPHSRTWSHEQPSSSRFTRALRPLLNTLRNGWSFPSRSSSYRALSSSPDAMKQASYVQIALSMIAAPRFRRYLVVYLGLVLLSWASWTMFLHPHLTERNTLMHALNPATEVAVGGWYGSNALPRLDDLTRLQTLDSSLLPGSRTGGHGKGKKSAKRLVVVGDVHGCKDELSRLLKKIEFSPSGGDHLILTGDIINKGPDSAGVVDLARELEASCVRGNHEDRILLLRHELDAKHRTTESTNEDEQNVTSHAPSDKEAQERELARSLNADQIKWLGACPVILDVGQIPTMGRVVVVHAGLVPGVELDKQDPSLAMTMRTIDPDTHFPSPSKKGIAWSKMFEKHQTRLYSSLKSSHRDPRSQTMTVIYGHDAKTGLNIQTYAKGLDSGCVKGGKLTALVIEDGGKQTIVQVKCKTDYTLTAEDRETEKKEKKLK
ncbi:Uncharacterized protein PECH_005869 [Penicillium ucsense]|uniref:Calcineurin-like phosphoesterase domain-containing protein n=1 Tax=Penicillium ucsense TaxID=2839758 RepID=A0A8J8W6A6_9EURO|nr:Uncharacterized protein PECM_000716 [Penicillium ucsense]KAF7736058.1 Uncharacterized protein PECH_005869 [Penicillium ucsense]